MATLGEWLAARRDDVPDTLWREIEACVTRDLTDEQRDDVNAAAGLAAVTVAQMTRMGVRSCTVRDDALALLTTDALVTYLLELAAGDPETDLETFAGDLLCNLVSIGRADA